MYKILEVCYVPTLLLDVLWFICTYRLVLSLLCYYSCMVMQSCCWRRALVIIPLFCLLVPSSP